MQTNLLEQRDAAPDVSPSQQLKAAMRRLASSVAVLSTRYDGHRYAMAATSVQSLSLDPPSIVACVNRNASFHVPLAARSDFAVNLLAAAQTEIAHACGGGRIGDARFEVGNWEENGEGPPFMPDAQAVLFCKCDGHLPYGTHGIFVGRVVGVELTRRTSPLIYLDGQYRNLDVNPA